MRNLLALLAVVVIGAVTAGTMRGWYTVRLVDADPGKTAFRVDIDRGKVGADFVAGARAVQNFLKVDQRGADRDASE